MAKRNKSKRVSKTVVNDLPDHTFPHLIMKPPSLLAAPAEIIETIYFSRVGHTFKQVTGPPFPPGSPPRYLVQDFLLDQTGTSGADGKMRATKSFDLTTAVSYQFYVLPKNPNKRIKVVMPPSTRGFFSFEVGRRFINAVSDYSDQSAAFSDFINPGSPPPAFTYNSFFIGHNTNHWINFRVMADVFSTFDFSGFRTYGIYPTRSFDPGLKLYKPFSWSVPNNLQSISGVPHLMFSYWTTNSVDPGPFVFLS